MQDNCAVNAVTKPKRDFVGFTQRHIGSRRQWVLL